MNEIQLSELLDRYINNTCSPEEKEVVDNWFELNKDKPDFTKTLSEERRERLKIKMFSAISTKVEIEPEIKKSGSVHPLFKSWWVKAGAAAILLLIVKFVLIDKTLPPNEPVTVVNADIVFVNHTKNIIKQVLPDSSVIWLNPNARLAYPKKFGAKSRNISMKGDCFFEVTKNPHRPFIISSDHIVTKVWGTSFSVSDDTDHPAAVVTVITGKVSVSKKSSKAINAGAKLLADEVMLMPNEQMVYNKSKHLITTSKQADVSALTIYKHVNLSFENARLTEIVSVLNEKFDANIKIQDEKLSSAMMTADLTDLNLPEVLDVLKTSMNLNYEFTNNVIVLKKTN